MTQSVSECIPPLSIKRACRGEGNEKVSDATPHIGGDREGVLESTPYMGGKKLREVNLSGGLGQRLLETPGRRALTMMSRSVLAIFIQQPATHLRMGWWNDFIRLLNASMTA